MEAGCYWNVTWELENVLQKWIFPTGHLGICLLPGTFWTSLDQRRSICDLILMAWHTAHLTQMYANPTTLGFPIPGTPEWTARIALLKCVSWDTLGRNPDTEIVSCYISHTEASLCQPLPLEHWRLFSSYQKYSQEIHPSFEKGRKRGSQLTRKECSWQEA